MGLFNYTSAERVPGQEVKPLRYRILSERMLRVLSVASVILVWQLIAGLQLLKLPSPIATFKVLVDLTISGDPLYNKTLPQIIWASLQIVLKACILSIIVAVPMGILMGAVEKVRKYLETTMEMVRPIPPLAWIPLAYVIFANTASPTEYVQIFVVLLGAFFPILLNTIHGITMVNRIHIEAARTMGATPRQILLRVMLPGALPAVFSGIRVGFGVGWMCIVAAEFVGGKLGIGYYIWSSYSVGGRTAEIISGMVAIGIVGSLINKAVLLVEKRLVPWR